MADTAPGELALVNLRTNHPAFSERGVGIVRGDLQIGFVAMRGDQVVFVMKSDDNHPMLLETVALIHLVMEHFDEAQERVAEGPEVVMKWREE